ncbi:MAG: hypothetical protein P1P88_19435, partial [Bacteroidales bacterium]|nr:hypothetical protein [Bacteroidales bacterium]
MLNIRFLSIVILSWFFSSCSDEAHQTARKFNKVIYEAENLKPGFNPLKHGFTCDSVEASVIVSGQLINKLILLLGSEPIDTISLLTEKIPAGAEKDIIITDFNFDGFCDFVLPDKAPAEGGGMNYYFYLYDYEMFGFNEVKSLPKFISDFKLDIKNHRVKIYCPYQDCFAYYS